MISTIVIVRCALVSLLACAAAPHALHAATFEVTVPPGANFDKANFRLWCPDELATIRAIVVLAPGSNEDGRTQADDPAWQDFARKHRLALIGVQFTDKPHDQMFIEHYVDVSKGSGPAFLDALIVLATNSGHAEIATAPLLLWGMSVGGEFNYEFVCWRPERVIAFVVNKGNVYYTALAPRAVRHVPGILFAGEKDLEFRTATVAGLFATNRRAGALWAYAMEPGVAHEVARSRDLAVMLYEEAISRRLPEGATELKPLNAEDGFFGDAKLNTLTPVAGNKPPAQYPVSWLMSERLAKAWQSVVVGKPF